MDKTTRLGMPLLSAGQAQKEAVHNEALIILDILLGGAAEEGPREAPPATPAVGQCFIVAAQPSGAWAGHGNEIAAFTAGGWRYIAPEAGMSLYLQAEQVTAAYSDGQWHIGDLRAERVSIDGQQVVGSRAAAIADPAGGSVVDAEARAAIAALLGALRSHGLIAG